MNKKNYNITVNKVGMGNDVFFCKVDKVCIFGVVLCMVTSCSILVAENEKVADVLTNEVIRKKLRAQGKVFYDKLEAFKKDNEMEELEYGFCNTCCCRDEMDFQFKLRYGMSEGRTTFFDAVRDCYGFDEEMGAFVVDTGAILQQRPCFKWFFTKELFENEFKKIEDGIKKK